MDDKLKEEIFDKMYLLKTRALYAADYGSKRDLLRIITEAYNLGKEEKKEVNPKDWTEDFSHENGNYDNICIYCTKSFLGHKRRVVCRQCFNTPKF